MKRDKSLGKEKKKPKERTRRKVKQRQISRKKLVNTRCLSLSPTGLDPTDQVFERERLKIYPCINYILFLSFKLLSSLNDDDYLLLLLLSFSCNTSRMFLFSTHISVLFVHFSKGVLYIYNQTFMIVKILHTPLRFF